MSDLGLFSIKQDTWFTEFSENLLVLQEEEITEISLRGVWQFYYFIFYSELKNYEIISLDIIQRYIYFKEKSSLVWQLLEVAAEHTWWVVKFALDYLE